MDYKAIGFKAGLEIHQQLDTHKLFCACPSRISDHVDYSFERNLRPTQSELGDVDRAALEEAKRKRRFRYSASMESTCLVEADEEPPHTANPEAVDICLTTALLLGAAPVDELHFMRKIVIDGSNTTGFQRTALVATNGRIHDVRIATLMLEEDAARKVSEQQGKVTYGLDRLGIPLIEITTRADITSPAHAREVAEQLGMLLQGTKQVKKGLGTIRQDLNISIGQGSRIEVKGIQSLSSIERVAENEVLRQKGILEIAQTLRKRAKKSDLETPRISDASLVFSNTTSKLVQTYLKKNGVVKGIRLPGFNGLLKQKDTRLGKDLSVYAGLASGIGGIIHSDEMPGYGFSEKEIDELKNSLGMTADDAFVLALGSGPMVDAALQAVLRRARMFFSGIPEEVRRSLPDDTTEYMRPLPGAARMYPETDVPPVRITKDHLNRLIIPERLEDKRTRLARQYNLNDEQITQLLAHGYDDEFEHLATRFPSLQNVISRTFLNTIPELEKESMPLGTINEPTLEAVFTALINEQFSKEAIPLILKYLAEHPGSPLEEAINQCNVGALDKNEAAQIIRAIVLQRKEFIREHGTDALGPIMGVVMKELRGKMDGASISKKLKEEIQRILSTP